VAGAAEAALRAGSRSVERILLAATGQRAGERHARMARLAERHRVPIEEVPPALVDELASGGTHGGVVAMAGARRYRPLAELAAGRTAPLVVMLDGVEDPYNLGQALRSLYAAGVEGVVLRERDWEAAAGVVARASAGASELMPTTVVAAPEQAATVLRQRGFRVGCTADRPSALPIDEANLRGPIFLLIGGERRGVTRSFLAAADLVLRVRPGRPDAPELGMAAAAAIIGYEALRQRRRQ
jgi:23S rRNA (guanosine2251-2'-O)-methyltransferase